MLDFLVGWYVREILGGRNTSIIWEESLAADASGVLTISDAVNGSIHASNLGTSDYIIYSGFAYANPGFVKVDIRPDNESTFKFRLDATSYPSRVSIMPPNLAEVEIYVDYVNESQPNDLYVSLNAVRLSEKNVAELTALSEDFMSIKDLAIHMQNLIRVGQGETVEGYEEAPQMASATEKREFCKRSKW